MQEESSWQDRLSQPIFLEHLNKTHQSIMCETEIKIAYIKKHVYKDGEETTHVKIGEEDIHHHHHHIYIYIYIKDKHNVCKHDHKTDVQEEGGKHSP